MFQVLGLFFEMENVSSNIEDWCGGPGHNVNINPIMNGYVEFIFPFHCSEWLSWFSVGYQVLVLHLYNVLWVTIINFRPLCAAILILILSFGVEGSLLNSYPKFKSETNINFVTLGCYMFQYVILDFL